MKPLDWLILLFIYFVAYGLWSGFDAYRERAPYRSNKTRRTVRRTVKLAVLAFMVIGLSALYNSGTVQTFLQAEPAVMNEESVSEPTTITLATLPQVTPPLAVPTQTPTAPTTTPVSTPAANVPQPTVSAPKAPKPLKVAFQSDPPGATLYINNERVGVTPIELALSEKEPLLYTLRAEQDVANHQLYHPYSGTLELHQDTSLSVWLERLNSEEVAALQQRTVQRQDVQEQKNQDAQGQNVQDQDIESEEAQPYLQHVSANTVRYVIATDCPEGLDLTYTDKMQHVKQERGRKHKWAYGFIPKPGQFLYLYAKNNCDSGWLNLELVQGDDVIQENTATGRNAIATVSTYW